MRLRSSTPCPLRCRVFRGRRGCRHANALTVLTPPALLSTSLRCRVFRARRGCRHANAFTVRNPLPSQGQGFSKEKGLWACQCAHGPHPPAPLSTYGGEGGVGRPNALDGECYARMCRKTRHRGLGIPIFRFPNHRAHPHRCLSSRSASAISAASSSGAWATRRLRL